MVDGAPWVDDPNRPDTPKVLYHGTRGVESYGRSDEAPSYRIFVKPLRGIRERVVFVTQVRSAASPVYRQADRIATGSGM